jgi:two-component system, LuxR family, sensor kinase FixL
MRTQNVNDASFLQAILQSAVEGIITISEHGVIESLNPAAERLFGYSESELIGSNVRVLMPPPYQDAHDGFLANYRTTGVKEIIGTGRDVVGRRKDGTEFPMSLTVSEFTHADKRMFAGFIGSLTERRQAEDAIRVQRRAMEAAVNGVVITDPTREDNPIVYVNPAMEKITGYSSEEVLGRNCRFLQNDARNQESLLALRTAIQEERECHIVLQNFRKDGTPFWNELFISPVRNNEGKLTNFVGIQSDITERKLAEEALARLNEELEKRVYERTTQLKEAQEQLIRKEKLATLGQLAGGVAHEIRNPLGVIRNAAYFLQQIHSNADEDTIEALNEISRGLINSERIVGELLDYASGPKIRKDCSLFLLDDVVAAALRMIEIPHSIAVTRPLPSELHLHADRGQIERLLANLFQNAIQAMPNGGALSISFTADKDSVATDVTDTGSGIARDDLERVFEPLFTKRAKGIGLGLTLCNRYAEQNGGTLKVKTSLGKGSTFTLTLPLAKQDAES